MGLKSKTAISLLGTAMGALISPMTAYCVQTNAVSNSQYSAQPSAPQPSAQSPTSTQTNDQPTSHAFNWNGSYIGVYGGGAWGNSSLNTNAGTLTPISYLGSAANISSVSQHGTGTVMPSNLTGGLQLVSNVQSNKLVYGWVLSAESFYLTGSKSASNITYPAASAQYKLKTAMSASGLAALRARLGFVPSAAWPLLYLTGGLALTNLHVYNQFGDNAGSMGVGGSTNTKIKAGWVVGGGVELPLRANWTVEGEYQFVNFGSNAANGFITCRGGCAPFKSPYSTAANLSASLVRLGLNYKFS